MADALAELERMARISHRFTNLDQNHGAEHPFVARDVHEALPRKVRRLFDDGYYAEATYEALKYLDSEMRRLSGISKTGVPLMMEALKENQPAIKLTPMGTLSEKDEQEGYRFLFAGSMLAIRNPRGHEHTMDDELETCLNHLGLATTLLRRLERAGYRLTEPLP